ncbi:hypothetical protein VTK73DRAFT_1878 [Phialemonium thermophilum]|uniref:Uncharacterized protein n=1 Tax=Phialemonium thermophilum TaxID=223376 RepID=A0ABR3VST8_9PEZI
MASTSAGLEPVKDSKAVLGVEDAVYPPLSAHSDLWGYGGRATIANTAVPRRDRTGKRRPAKPLVRCPAPRTVNQKMAVALPPGMSHRRRKGASRCGCSRRHVFLFGDRIVGFGGFGGSTTETEDRSEQQRSRSDVGRKGLPNDVRDATTELLVQITLRPPSLARLAHHCCAFSRREAGTASCQRAEGDAIHPNPDSRSERPTLRQRLSSSRNAEIMSAETPT